jgi:hypothetical protein
LEKEEISVMSRPWDIFKEKQKVNFSYLTGLDYINDEGLEVPENTIAVVRTQDSVLNYDDIAKSLIGHPSRDWFMKYASFCLPLTIGNQYGFVITAQHDAEIFWDGESMQLDVKSEGLYDYSSGQTYALDFGPGVLTIDHTFVFRTPPGINLMTIQPPNYFIDGMHVMCGVVESDNLRRSFTFNIKVTSPNKKIIIKKGDWLAAFIPIPRGFVDSFKLVSADKIFSAKVIENEAASSLALGWQRTTHKDFGGDKTKINDSGRRYFKGVHVDDTPYKNHQKRI